ncbi:putative iron-regulated membrane protein [Bradyrhizobium sp. USDA 4449]
MHKVWPAIKAALLQLHSIAGLLLALLLSLIALTGAIMSFEDEIVEHLNADIMQVATRRTPALTPDELVARLKAVPDAGKVAAITLSSDPSTAVHIRFVRDEQGSRPSSFYVDSYDGHVLGVPRGEDFFATVRRLHRWLLIPGDAKGWGRRITGVAALGLIVMLISGFVLRWPRRASSLKMWLKPDLGLRGRGLHRSLHAVIGTWVLPIYLAMTLTGLWYSFDSYKDGVLWLLSRPHVAAAKTQPKQPRPPGRAEPAQPIGFDRAWSALRREEANGFAKAQLALPAGPGTVIRIRAWGKDSTLESMRDEFRIDAVSGEVISAERYADKTLGERAIAGVLDIHRGAVLGWPGRLIFMIAAALMPLFAITGVLLYLSRRKLRPSRQRATLGDNAADRTGERQVAALSDTKGKLDRVELRQVRQIASVPQRLALAEPDGQGGKAEAGLDGADQRREAARLTGDGPFAPDQVQAAQGFAAIGATVREGDQRNSIAGPV